MNPFGRLRSFRLFRNGFIRPCSSLSSIERVSVEVKNGLPYITIPLPSRDESCVFVLRPVSQTVGDFLSMLREEDRGIDRAVVKDADGIRISSTAPVQTLLENDFHLHINDKSFQVSPPSLNPVSDGELQLFGDVKARVSQLFGVLHVPEYLAQQEDLRVRALEAPKQELALMEPQFQILSAKAATMTDRYLYYYLAIPSFQFGFLARLTWFEYSWDIMEPITYFVTAFSGILCFKYFIMTQSEYQFYTFKERIYLIHFYKQAAKVDFDIKRYNDLCQDVEEKEKELKKFRELKALGIVGSFS